MLTRAKTRFRSCQHNHRYTYRGRHRSNQHAIIVRFLSLCLVNIQFIPLSEGVVLIAPGSLLAHTMSYALNAPSTEILSVGGSLLRLLYTIRAKTTFTF